MIVPDTGWSPVRTLVSSARWPPVPGQGDEDHIVFDLPADMLFAIETRYPHGKADAQTYADTLLFALDARGLHMGSSDFGGQGRNARILAASTIAGTYGAIVRSHFGARRTGRYQLRVRTLGPVQARVLTAVSPQQIVSVPDG